MIGTKNIAKDWAEKVAKSNGTMLNVPASMKEKTVDFQKKSDEYIHKAKQFDRLSAEFDLFAKNFWHDMRKVLEDSGTEEIWGKNIGFNQEAKKDGITVINLVKNQPQGMPMR